MIKVAQPSGTAFHNLKCGEIFFISPAVYNVTCCFCTSKMHLDQFPSHFQIQHLTLIEENINLTKDTNPLGNMTIKEDPIKQDEMEKQTDEDDKTLQQLLRETENARCKQENIWENSSLEPVEDLNIGDKLGTKVVAKKPVTRKSRRKFIKTSILEEDKKPDVEKLNEFKCENNESNKVIECESNQEEDGLKKYDGEDTDMDKDWWLENKTSDTDSDPDGKNSPTDEMLFPCLICKRSYLSKNSLQKHNYNVHNPNKPPKKRKQPKGDYKCDQCNEVCRTVRDLRSHKLKHTGIFCDVCGKTFSQASNLIRHKVRHTGIKAHKCKECDKDFFTSKELKAHMICHTGLMKHICEICGKRCRDRGVLTAHMRRHTGERPAKCDVCGKCFFSFHDLNIHAVTHSSERPFKCDICGSTFQRKKALRVHKLIHSTDRKHVCKICGKGFAQSGGLRSHMRTHDAALEKTTN